MIMQDAPTLYDCDAYTLLWEPGSNTQWLSANCDIYLKESSTTRDHLKAWFQACYVAGKGGVTDSDELVSIDSTFESLWMALSEQGWRTDVAVLTTGSPHYLSWHFEYTQSTKKDQ